MWGNLQRIDGVIVGSGVQQPIRGQLCKISYKRPETWHWMFSARLISGPDNSATFFSRIFVNFDVVIGVGRSVLRMALEPRAQSFETYVFRWGPTNPAFPRGAHIYTSQAVSPSRDFEGDGTTTTPGALITELVAQDIQVNVSVLGITLDTNVAAIGQPFSLEVSALFAPKTHIRPDWLRIDVPMSAQFPGEEIEGR
jgi:hypothetical protein